MNKNFKLIVNKISSYYSILTPMCPKESMLYVTYQPYSGEDTYLCDIKGTETIIPEAGFVKRPFFILKSKGCPEVLGADRLVDIGGIENFRDQGGYYMPEGKTVKWGRFYRGGAMTPIDEASRASLNTLGIRTVLDYRDKKEADKKPDYIPNGATYKLLCAAGRPDPETSGADISSLMEGLMTVQTQEQADSIYSEFASIYRKLPLHNSAYAAMFDALDKGDTVPIYQHCSAGKDRTGVGGALLLLALGVDRDTVMGDYCLSAVYREEVNRKYIERVRLRTDNPAALDLVRRLLTVEKGLLQISFDAIDALYPDTETFLYQEYGITQERLTHWRELHLI